MADAEGSSAIIGLDTGIPIASLAVIKDGKIAAEIARSTASHGAALPDAVNELLRAAGITIREVGAIAVGIGPGSFTGLRIGLSYAKGIALASGSALIGVPSLDSIALGALEAAPARIGAIICPILDARKGEVYTALYRIVPDGLEKLTRDLVMPLARLTSNFQGEAILAGDARANDAAALLASRDIGVTVLASRILASRATYIAVLGASRVARGESDPIATLEPLYVRPPEADAALTAASPATTEGDVWSAERKNSFGNI